MSATVNKEQIECAKRVYSLSETIKAECKIDSLENCEILSAIPRLSTPKAETLDGAIKVRGRITFFVVYKQDSAIKRAETSAEYLATIKNENVESAHGATATPFVIKTDEYYTGSTLLLTATILINCDLFKTCQIDFISSGQDIILKTETTPIGKSFGKKQNKLTVTEEFEIPKLVDEVIFHTENAFVTECKAGIGSILVDGECSITSYILQKSSNSDIVKETHAFPLRLEIDEEHAMPTMQATAHINVEDAKIFVTAYEETGLSAIKIELDLLLEGEAFDLVETPIAVDAYSLSEQLNLTHDAITLEQPQPPACLTEKFCERLTFEEFSVGTRLITAYPNGSLSFCPKNEGDKFSVEATLGFTAVFKDNDDAIFSKCFTIPLIINTDYVLTNSESVEVCSFAPTDFCVKQISLGELEVYGTVRFCAYVTTKTEVMALIDATVSGEIAPNDNAFSVYVACPNEDLWTISKRIGISPDEVIACNPELDFPLSGSERILIYRQKIKEYT